MGRLRTVVIALMVLIVGASCSDDDLTAQGVFAAQLAALNARMSDINMAAMTDIDLTDRVLDTLTDGFQGDVPQQPPAMMSKGVTDLGGSGWQVSLIGVDYDTSMDTYLGFVGVGFRTTKGTLEAFIFFTDGLMASDPGFDPFIYIKDLNAEDLVTDNLMVGGGTLYTLNRGAYDFDRDDCMVAGGPYIGEYTHDLQFNIAATVSSPMASPDSLNAKALGVPFNYPVDTEATELITIPGFYYWDS
ncbi:MAG: hypothetical protein KDH09_13570, partial [Chrysiogenetes bacterium]|nr:hypothetical protein [Chrysiogenetes bacterium]